MFQIAEHIGPNRRGISREEFTSRFFKICESHRAQGRALAFAFILYDRRHAQLGHVLDNDRYWTALDEVSGRQLTVFSFDVRVPARRRTTYSSNPDLMYALFDVSISEEDEPTDVLAERFPGLTLNRLPCILFFQVDGERVLDSFAISVAANSGTVDAAFAELNDVLTRAVRSLARVEDENAVNAQEILNLIRSAMENKAFRDGSARVIDAATGLVTVAELVRLLITATHIMSR